MCRLYGFRANEPTKVECSLVLAQNALLAQSRLDAKGEAHPDGWGIGVYDGAAPVVERRATAAFEDLHFGATAERVFASTVVAHVRQATVGGADLDNTHPFVHGRWIFAHNGTLTGFRRLRPRLEAGMDPDLRSRPRGTTDSEFLFYWLLDRMARGGLLRHPADLGGLMQLFAEVVPWLAGLSDEVGAEEDAKLNFLLTDGDVLVATCWGRTLFWVPREGLHDCEVCGIPHVRHDDSVDYRAVVVASEPLSDEPWQEIPRGTVVAVDGDVRTRLLAM